MGKWFALARPGMGCLALVSLLSTVVARPAQDSSGLSAPMSIEVFRERADKLSLVAASLAGVEQRTESFVVSAPQREHWASGWNVGCYIAEDHELFVDLELPASVDQALFSMVQFELERGLGEPSSPWFARGVAHALMGTAGGLELAVIEGRTGAVTPREVFGDGGRPRLTLAPAEARLARCLMVELGLGVADAWKVAAPGDPALNERLTAAWARSLGVSGISPQLAYPRSVGEGTYVALEAPSTDFGTEQLEAELTRIASLGARGVVIPVPTVVSERGAALISTALFARKRGLSVVLAPRFLPWLSDVVPSDLEDYSVRRDRAIEALSWLAELAEVDGLILFDGSELRLPPGVELKPGVRAARRSFRRRLLVASRPFSGDRLAFAKDEASFQSARSEDFSSEFSGAHAVINLKVGIGDTVESLGMTVVGPWSLTRSEDAPPGLRDLPDDVLIERFGASTER